MKSLHKKYASLLFASLSFLQGMASTLDIGGTLITYNMSPSPEEADRSALAHDWFIVGEEIEGAMVSYGKSL